MSEPWKTLKEWPELILERLADASVARIVLNRPEKRNCWNRALCDAFVAALDIIRADKELKRGSDVYAPFRGGTRDR